MIPESAGPVLETVAPLGERFAGAGHRLFLVGGIVRDLIAGRLVDRKDLDLTTDATPGVVKDLVRPLSTSLWTQGERFGTIGCVIDGEPFEITTHRAESYNSDSRKPDVEFSTEIEVDLSRRDFTVNAMAIEVTNSTPVLIDPFDGRGDLDRKTLRTPIAASASFSDDPLRMLRAARFIAGFGLAPEPELVRAVESMGDRLSIVSPERVRDELCKLVLVANPSDGLAFLEETALLGHFLPELPALRGRHDPAHGSVDLLDHTVALVQRVPPDLITRLAALLHVGVTPDDRMRALRFSNEQTAAVTGLVRQLPRVTQHQGAWSDADIRRLVRDVGPWRNQLLLLAAAESTAIGRSAAANAEVASGVDALERRIAELGRGEDLDSLGPALDGDEVMAHLELGPGRDVGRALAHLLELRLDQGPMDRESALAALDRWWADR